MPPPPEAGPAWPWPLRIETFGRFALSRAGAALALPGKTPEEAARAPEGARCVRWQERRQAAPRRRAVAGRGRRMPRTPRSTWRSRGCASSSACRRPSSSRTARSGSTRRRRGSTPGRSTATSRRWRRRCGDGGDDAGIARDRRAPARALSRRLPRQRRAAALDARGARPLAPSLPALAVRRRPVPRAARALARRDRAVRARHRGRHARRGPLSAPHALPSRAGPARRSRARATAAAATCCRCSSASRRPRRRKRCSSPSISADPRTGSHRLAIR